MYVRRRQGLGSVTSAVQSAIAAASPAINAAQKILEDPALPEVSGLVLKLHSLQQNAPAKPGQPAPATQKGIGLSKIVKPLRAYVYSQEHAWVIPAVIGGIIALPFVLGRFSKR